MKGTCATYKEMTDSKKSSGFKLFPKRLVVNDLESFDEKPIARNFNKLFTEIGPKIASEIPHSLVSFEHF